jgi:hypothetical protein
MRSTVLANAGRAWHFDVAEFPASELAALRARLRTKGHPANLPYAHPVSLDRALLASVLQAPADWRAMPKADGVRCFFLAYADGRATFVGRTPNLAYQGVHLFPLPHQKEGELAAVIDGEVIETPDGFRLLAFDLPYGPQVRPGAPLLARLQALAAFEGASFGIGGRISVKPTFPLERLPELLRPGPTTAFPCDGLVLTRASAPYRNGTNQNMLKWKPLHLSTVDGVVRNGHLHALDTHSVEVNIGPVLGYDPSLVLHPKTVVECAREGNAWRVLRPRSDKDRANSLNVARRVVRAHEDGLTAERLWHALQPALEAASWASLLHTIQAAQGVLPPAAPELELRLGVSRANDGGTFAPWLPARLVEATLPTEAATATTCLVYGGAGGSRHDPSGRCLYHKQSLARTTLPAAFPLDARLGEARLELRVQAAAEFLCPGPPCSSGSGEPMALHRTSWSPPDLPRWRIDLTRRSAGAGEDEVLFEIECVDIPWLLAQDPAAVAGEVRAAAEILRGLIVP